MTESFTERTAGTWIPTVFYAVGGVYILAFWGMFSPSAYHLLVLGIASLITAVLLFELSKWAYWIGLFTFPLLLVEFALALTFSVNVVGWAPNSSVALFNGTMVAYLVLLCFSFLLLVDRRNVLKTDRLLDRLRVTKAVSSSETAEKKST